MFDFQSSWCCVVVNKAPQLHYSHAYFKWDPAAHTVAILKQYCPTLYGHLGNRHNNRISEVKLSPFKKSYTIPCGFLQWLLREASLPGFLRKLCSVYFYDFSVTLPRVELLLGEIDMRLSADIIIWRDFCWGNSSSSVRLQKKPVFHPHTKGVVVVMKIWRSRWQHSSSQQMLKVFCLFLVPLNKYESRFFSSCSLRCQALRHIVFLSLCTGFFPKINGEATSKKMLYGWSSGYALFVLV